MAQEDDISVSPFLQTMKMEQLECDEDSTFFGMVDNEDKQGEPSEVFSPNTLVNLALSLDQKEVIKSLKKLRKNHHVHMPMHIPPHWENYPLVIDGAIADALSFANIDQEKKERMAVALKAVLVARSTLTASKDTYQVPYTTLQTYFHRIRHSLCFVLGDSGVPACSARIITTKITYSQLLEQLTQVPETSSKEKRGVKIFRDESTEEYKENESLTKHLAEEDLGREQGNRRFPKAQEDIGVHTPTTSIQLRTRKSAESKQNLAKIPVFSGSSNPTSSKRSRKSSDQTVEEPTASINFLHHAKNGPETLVHCQKIFELMKAAKFFASVQAIEKHFPDLLKTQKELSLLLKANKLVELARKLQLQSESRNASISPTNIFNKLEAQSRMFLELGQISSDVVGTLKLETAKGNIADQSLQEAEKRVKLAFAILSHSDKPATEDFEQHQLEQLVEYFRMLLVMLKIVPMSFSLFKK